MAAELPEGLKDNTKGSLSFRQSSKQLSIGAASDKYGIGQAALWKNLKKVPKDHCTGRSDTVLRLFIDNLPFKSPDLQHFFTDDKVALMLTTACAAKLAGEGQSDLVM
eukprot:2028156-Rhodomonas_salina.1